MKRLLAALRFLLRMAWGYADELLEYGPVGVKVYEAFIPTQELVMEAVRSLGDGTLTPTEAVRLANRIEAQWGAADEAKAAVVLALRRYSGEPMGGE